jgi:uncharacterized integral membrane protein
MGTSPALTRPAVRTWLDLAWLVRCGSAVVVFAGLSVFMLQNTGSADFSFLWMDGTAPVAVALLIATAGGILLAGFRRVVRRRG